MSATRGSSTSAEVLESLLARLYVDDSLREAFLADPGRIARAEGLDEVSCAALCRIDREGLMLAAGSYAQKRAKARPASVWKRLASRLGF